MFYRIREAAILLLVIFLAGVAAQLALPPVANCLGLGTTPYEMAPVDEKPIAGDQTALVIGLSEVLVAEHGRLTESEAAFRQLRAEATQIVQTLIREIDRLKSRPTLQPGDETAGEPTPADPI